MRDFLIFIVKVLKLNDSVLIALNKQMVYGSFTQSLAEEIFFVFTINMF
jgi:hypothetical protein